MAERCNSCGAELFTGQQFCRACGTPTRQFSSEELPTRILPPNAQDQPTPAASPSSSPPPLATSPLPGRDTSEQGFGAGYSRYQPPPVPQHAHAPVVAPPPRRRSRAWLYAALGLLLFFAGASVVAGLFFIRPSPQPVKKVVTRPNIAVPRPPHIPPPPHPIAEGIEGVEVSGAQSIITKTYPLAKDGSFSLRNFSGDITVEGWDEQQAEVKIIKRGGSEEPNDPLHVVRQEGGNRLVFNTRPDKPGGVMREVQYIVKLPRNLRELEIVSMTSNVSLSGVHSASISINVQHGNIELEDVSGTVNSRTTKGNTTVLLSEAAKGAPQVFNGIHGNIELELPPGMNADLKAETVDGDIDIDEDLGIKVEQRVIGRSAVGRLGAGGQPIVVKVVSGNIKIKT
jgi:hypothetical protein